MIELTADELLTQAIRRSALSDQGSGRGRCLINEVALRTSWIRFLVVVQVSVVSGCRDRSRLLTSLSSRTI